jgi:hypothetical protein
VSKPVPKLGCAFYKTVGGEQPVREWLRALDDVVCTIIGKDILKVQWRWPISKPLVGTFGEGLYEVDRPTKATSTGCSSALKRGAWFCSTAS